MAEIPFWFHDRPKWVSGINKHTTCQDILHSLVRAHVDKSAATSGKARISDSDLKRTAGQLALVEQWRGVERPLSDSSKILKLWLAWGEERSQVKFVVKRVSSSSSSAQQPASGTLDRKQGQSSASSIASGKRTRRRNSRLTSSRAGDLWSKTDTFHPSALTKSGSSAAVSKISSSVQSSEIERLMRIILTQGETIHSQLKKLQEREGQIDTIEQKVHDTRTKTAGKDYLLNAYLNEKRSSDHEQDVPECLREMIEALGQVHKLNEKLENTEDKVNDLHCQLSLGAKGKSSVSPKELESTKVEVNQLKVLNEKIGKEIDYNRHLITNMKSAFDERKALVTKLEKDVCCVESEGHKLQVELQRVKQMDATSSSPLFMFDRVPLIPSPPHHHHHQTSDQRGPTDEELDEELLNDILGGPHGSQFHLSNSQLYEDHQPPMRPNEDEEKLYSQLHKLHIKTGGLELMSVPSSSCTDSARINATGSPGSSTSGNSSGSGTVYSEKSVRFSDRDMIMATPDLPPLPPGDFPNLPNKGHQQVVSQYTKSILKSVDASGDLDSNSDTGLSSLHSSSDEGTYVLDTLV